MYEPHANLPVPPRAAQIWRYMDEHKFRSLVETRCLYLARGDRFEDPYEGMLHDEQALSIRQYGEDVFQMWHRAYLNGRLDTYVNCWHVSADESDAMWKIYAKRGSGVAIVSTFGALLDSLQDEPREINAGLVQYGYDHVPKARMPNMLVTWTMKRKAYEYEQELRLLSRRPRNNGFVGMMTMKGGRWTVAHTAPVASDDTPLGVLVRIRLQVLLHRILLSPDSDDATLEQYRAIIQKYEAQYKEQLPPVSRSLLHTYAPTVRPA